MRLGLLACTVLAATACGNGAATDESPLVSAAEPALGTARAEVRELLRSRIEMRGQRDLSARGHRIRARATLARFYGARGYAPAWLDRACPGQPVRTLLGELRAVALDGLDGNGYHTEVIGQLLAGQTRCLGAGLAVETAADLELLATDGFLLLTSHLLGGRLDPATLGGEWHARRRELDLAALLEEAVAGRELSSAVARARPQAAEYVGLRSALAEYGEIVRRGGWPAVEPGPKLGPGTSGPRVAVLRERLVAEGYLAATAGDQFDAGLEAAVQSFQNRHGLPSSGELDSRTLAALNVPALARADQIAVNLERWRWLPDPLGRRHIRVNVPTFELEVIENDTSVLSMRAVVGKPYRQTPVVSATMTQLVLNPSWGVPRSIATKDILPRVKADPEYLEKHGFTVFLDKDAKAEALDPASIDWHQTRAATFRYRLRQKPGPDNSLGKIKFLFPNPFSVYIHDTPAHDLFSQNDRTFSSGCIRVENVLDLAEHVLRPNRDWARARIERALDTGREQTVALSEHIPVHLLYFTAWSDAKGKVHFRRDAYERDRRVLEALRAPPSAARGRSEPRRGNSAKK